MLTLTRTSLFLTILCPLCAAAGDVDCRPVPFSRSEARFTTLDNPDYRAGDPEHLKEWRVMMRPTGGQLGLLEITSLPADALPCTARLRVYQALPKDLLPPRKEPADPEWFQPMGLVNPAAPLRALRFEHRWTLESLPASLPIALPQTLQGLNRCLLELLDPRGRVIHSLAPAEIVSAESSSRWRPFGQCRAWILSDDEMADRRIREQTDIREVETLKDAPGQWTDYNEVGAIWIDEHAEVSAPLLRRFILSGGWIVGRRNALDAVCGRLGLPAGLAVLGGGIAALDDPRTARGEDERRIPRDFDHDRFDFASAAGCGKEHAYPLENAGGFFRRIRTRFFVFTFSFAGLFALGATVLLPVLFLTLKGDQRVALWWKAPAVLVMYSLLVLAVGWTWVLPRAPLTDVTEYRMGYGDWPEVFCNTHASSLKFGRKPMGWILPPGMTPLFINGREAVPLLTDGGSRAGTMAFGQVARGRLTSSGYGTFRDMRQPFSAELKDGRVRVYSSRAVRALHAALENGHWLKLGPADPGGYTLLPDTFEPVSINGCPALINDVIQRTDEPGFPLSTEEPKAPVCKHCGKVHGTASHTLKLVNGAMILIAVDSEDSPGILALNGNEIREARVAWICQVPLKGWSPPEEHAAAGGPP